MALDGGQKRIGLAVTDPLQLIATALATVPAHTVIDYLTAYLAENQVERFVVGEPRQMDGSPSQSAPYVQALTSRLKKAFPHIPVTPFDERFTSKLAQRALIDSGAKRSTRRDKSIIDRLSALILLQDYLNSSLR